MLVDILCHLHLLKLDDPVVVELPLRGEWSVERTRRTGSRATARICSDSATPTTWSTPTMLRVHLHPAGSLRLFVMGDGRGTATAGGRPED